MLRMIIVIMMMMMITKGKINATFASDISRNDSSVKHPQASVIQVCCAKKPIQALR